MKIYHYTSIETLALILNNKRIRFNRLDFVDDLEESLYGSGPTGIKFGQYTFVSCWTKDSKENIALWNMYTKNKGVRIGLDADMFVTYSINKNLKSFFKDDMVSGNALFPIFPNEAKLYEIKYVQDVESNVLNLMKKVGENGAGIKTEEIGLYKREEWAFQKECRFKIIAFPFPPFGVYNMGRALRENKPVDMDHIDIPLKEEVLDSIEIMLGPQTTEGERIIVKSLLANLKNATIVDSYFKGKIKK